MDNGGDLGDPWDLLLGGMSMTWTVALYDKLNRKEVSRKEFGREKDAMNHRACLEMLLDGNANARFLETRLAKQCDCPWCGSHKKFAPSEN